MSQSAMPVLSRALVPEVLPAVMPDVPAVPGVLPAPLPELVLPARLPADLPAAGRAALAAALAGTVPGGRPERGGTGAGGGRACWDEAECARLLRFLDAVGDPRDPRGRVYPLSYLLALPLVAGMAGDDELDAAGEWAASAPGGAPAPAGRAAGPVRAGAPPGRDHDRPGPGRRRSGASTTTRCAPGPPPVPGRCSPACASTCGIDGKALRGARRGGRTPMLLSGIWDDGTTAAQLPVNVARRTRSRSSASCWRRSRTGT